MTNPTNTLRSGTIYTTSTIAVTINDQGVQSISLEDPRQLFNTGYASHDGNFISLTPDRATVGVMLGMAAAGKRGAEARSLRHNLAICRVRYLLTRHNLG